jgi:hypothetical protein
VDPLTLFGIGKAAQGSVTAVGNILDALFTSDEERLDKKILLERLLQNPQLAQIELNKVEASHPNVWVAGWRPFIGWVCGSALAYHYILRDFFMWGVRMWSETPIEAPPTIDMAQLVSILLAMLGMVGYRTFEKMKGIES